VAQVACNLGLQEAFEQTRSREAALHLGKRTSFGAFSDASFFAKFASQLGYPVFGVAQVACNLGLQEAFEQTCSCEAALYLGKRTSFGAFSDASFFAKFASQLGYPIIV
jgi:hypothetical protein